ncbi:MAG: GNAT family N-acetyltransferase [Oscillospiraceae bacterium]|nr:GNAT family N-acetyltransferase [Oscillospiraceae bacterium]
MNAEIDVTDVTLHTPRLTLRPWRQTDLQDLYAYASDPEVGPMAGWKPHESPEESQMILDRFVSGRKTFALEYRGRVVGSIGVEGYDEARYPEFSEQRVRMLGFVLARECWGRGLMPEGVSEVIRWLFEEQKLDVILCGHFLWNKQSGRVQEKCGFRHYDFGLFTTKQNKVEEDELRILTRADWLSAQWKKP